MEGIPPDVIICVSLALIAGITILLYAWRKLGASQEGARDESTQSAATATRSPPGRLVRHPGGECPICLSLDLVGPVQTNCGHWFCARCILDYYDGLGRVRIKCPLCRQEVTMLHGAAEDVVDEPAASADVDSAATGSGIPTTAAGRATSPTSSSAETQEQIARFNERSSGRRRTPWQVIEDAPLLLRRLVSDLRRGDTQVFGELIRRGVQLHLLVIALYILSPVDIIPEGFLGIVGLLDDFLVAIVFFIHITAVYRTILMSWNRPQVASTPGTAGVPTPETNSPTVPADTNRNRLGGVAAAAIFAVAAGSLVSDAGGGVAAAVAAVATGVATARYIFNVRALPPLARDW